MSRCMFMIDDNTSLRQFCLKNGYDYQTIRRCVLELGYTIQDAINDYANRKGRHDTKTKYFYQGQKLTDYCKDVGYPYQSIIHIIKDYRCTTFTAVKMYENWRRRKINDYGS